MNNDHFKPKIIIRNPLVQTILASLKIRNTGRNPMLESAEEMIISGGNGEHLLGYYSRQNGDANGTVLLIHGWEGSSDSAYILNTGNFLFGKGYDIVRLNLRDHGESHHLNKGIFKSTLLDETFGAVSNVAMLNKSKPFFMIGFSLGGNFVLRMANKADKTKIKNLMHAVAISPVIDPKKSMAVADRISFIRKYFLKKWTLSLLKKQALFPDIYDFRGIRGFNTLLETMEAFVPKYTEFGSTDEYYSRYAIPNDAFKDLIIPTTIITSKDDPIIPADDFYKISPNANLNILIKQYGGHSGFLDLFPHIVWYEEKILEIFSKEN